MVDDCEVQLRDSRGNSRSFGSQGKVGLVSLQLSYSPSKTPEKKQSSSREQGCSSPSSNFQSCSHPERSRKSNNEERMELGENPNQSDEELVDIAENSFSDMDDPGRRVGDENPNQSVDKLVDIAGNSFNDMDGSGRAGEEDPNQSVDEVVDIAGNSFCGMDEPPIAFDDSWGLDGGVGSQKPCFSLRLDSSEGIVSPPGLKGKGPTSTSPLASGACTKTPDPSPGPFNHSLPDPDMWDDWEEEEVAFLPLSQRLTGPSAKRVAELKTPGKTSWYVNYVYQEPKTLGLLSPIYTSASNLRHSLRRDAQACAVTYTVPDVHLSKNLTPSLCMYLSFVRVYEHCNIV